MIDCAAPVSPLTVHRQTPLTASARQSVTLPVSPCALALLSLGRGPPGEPDSGASREFRLRLALPLARLSSCSCLQLGPAAYIQLNKVRSSYTYVPTVCLAVDLLQPYLLAPRNYVYLPYGYL